MAPRVEPGEERRDRRQRPARLRDGVLEDEAAGGERVERRARARRGAVAAEAVGAQRVDEERRARSARRRAAGCRARARLADDAQPAPARRARERRAGSLGLGRERRPRRGPPASPSRSTRSSNQRRSSPRRRRVHDARPRLPAVDRHREADAAAVAVAPLRALDADAEAERPRRHGDARRRTARAGRRDEARARAGAAQRLAGLEDAGATGSAAAPRHGASGGDLVRSRRRAAPVVERHRPDRSRIDHRRATHGAPRRARAASRPRRARAAYQLNGPVHLAGPVRAAHGVVQHHRLPRRAAPRDRRAAVDQHPVPEEDLPLAREELVALVARARARRPTPGSARDVSGSAVRRFVCG